MIGRTGSVFKASPGWAATLRCRRHVCLTIYFNGYKTTNNQQQKNLQTEATGFNNADSRIFFLIILLNFDVYI